MRKKKHSNGNRYHPINGAKSPLDVREFPRFVLSGIAATIGKHGSRLADTPFPVFRNCVIGRDLYGRCNIVRALKVFCVPVAFVEPFGRRSGEVLDRLCDGLHDVLDGSGCRSNAPSRAWRCSRSRRTRRHSGRGGNDDADELLRPSSFYLSNLSPREALGWHVMSAERPVD